MATFTFKQKNVYYQVLGTGKPLLILNGIMMSTNSWKPFVPAFSANNQLILVDFLDQGQSEKMSGEEAYSQEVQVELVNALLKELKLEKINLVGISYGGEVALQFASKYANKVERLILFNAGAYTSPWLSDIGKSWNLAAQTGKGENYFFTTIPLIYSPTYYEAKIEWMRARKKVLIPVFGNPTFTDAMVRLTNSAESHDVRKDLCKITAETLIVSSEEDFITPMAEQRYLHEHIPSSHYVVLPRTGHASMYERPLLFASLVLGFVNVSQTEFTI